MSFLGDIRYPTLPLVLSGADGYIPGGGLLYQTLRADGTPPYLASVSPAVSNGISVHYDETTGLPIFISGGKAGDFLVGTFDITLLDSSTPKRSRTAYRYTVTHAY